MFNYFLEYNRYLSLLGILILIGVAFLFSRKRSKVNLQLVVNALLLLFILGFLVLKTDG